MKHSLLPLGAALLALGFGTLPAAQAQNVKPPKAQLWMDVSTGGMAGMPDMDSGVGAMLGGMMGGGNNTTYGMARGMSFMPPRVLDIALYNRLKPGVEAAQLIPPGARMGDKLPLLPPPPAQPVKETEPSEVPEEYKRETPKGRILIYWGCGAEVRPGQPRIIDLARANPADFGTAFAGRFAPDRGARVGPGFVLFPNERNRVSLSRESSLVGDHQIQGDGVPPSFKFTLGAAQDVMPAIELQSSGTPKDSIALNWRSVNQARAYFLHAMGTVGENDMVMWSSSDTPDSGMGLFDYLPNATIDRWIKDKVLLTPETTQCAIPRGIFAAKDAGAGRRGDSGGMLRMIAYGSESNFAYPPRPADPKAVWEPDWAVRVRVKSSTMAMLGEEPSGGRAARSRRGSDPSGNAPPPAASQDGSAGAAPATPSSPSIGDVLSPIGNPANVLKGLFGR
ncbi:MAG TPA: hypothetical protein PKY40_06240 [Burkholderiaceae bacterium]|jgi:hypothetical protein|nr:hypothetical protein [Burkholderiaceae bacterium]